MRDFSFSTIATVVVVSLFIAGCGGGSSDSDSAADHALPVITEQPADVTVAAGEPVQFSVSVKDPAGVTFQWLRNDVAIYGAIDNKIRWTGAPASWSGSVITVRVNNAAGGVVSRDARLTVVSRQNE